MATCRVARPRVGFGRSATQMNGPKVISIAPHDRKNVRASGYMLEHPSIRGYSAMSDNPCGADDQQGRSDATKCSTPSEARRMMGPLRDYMPDSAATRMMI